MDLLGSYASDSDHEDASEEVTASATTAQPQPPASSSPLNLSSLLPPVSSSTSTVDPESRKRKKLEKREKKEAKRRKQEEKSAAGEDAAAAASSTSSLFASMPTPVATAASQPIVSSSKLGLSAMLPPPKFSKEIATSYVPQTQVTTLVQPAAIPASVPAPVPVPTPSITPSRAPPGIRPPPGIRAQPIAAVPSNTDVNTVAPVPSSSSAAEIATYADAMHAANSFAAAASSSTTDESADAAQDVINAELARNAALLDDDPDTPYVPLYARKQQSTASSTNSTSTSVTDSLLTNLSGQDKQFKRLLQQSGATKFYEVNQNDLTHRSLHEEALAQYDDKHAAQHAALVDGKVKVQAKFWNSKTGQMESTTDLSSIAKSKNQLNAVAMHAGAMEIEMARQRQAGYAKRDNARKKYGF